jgi:hypothetical protein
VNRKKHFFLTKINIQALIFNYNQRKLFFFVGLVTSTIWLQMHDDFGSGVHGHVRHLLDGVGAVSVRRPVESDGVGAARQRVNVDLVGNHERRVEADTELKGNKSLC